MTTCPGIATKKSKDPEDAPTKKPHNAVYTLVTLVTTNRRTYASTNGIYVSTAK